MVSFKGTTLGLYAYGNSVVRPSADLDLLVSRAHALRARDLLASLGYAPEIALSRAQEKVALRVDSVFNLFRPAPPRLRDVLAQGYAAELHWAITSPCLPFDLEYESVAPHLQWIDLPGVATSEFADSTGVKVAILRRRRLPTLKPRDFGCALWLPKTCC